MNYPRLRPKIPAKPSIRLEKELAKGHDAELVAGVDEAGRGPLAGPVVAAAVILDYNGPRPVGLNDSKKVKPGAREALCARIKRQALAWSIGMATSQEIDLLNILEATRLAARRALNGLAIRPHLIVTDCLEIPSEQTDIIPIIKGDAVCASISAASIIAKVTRDRLMLGYDKEFPEYGWAKNQGYPTTDHYEAIGAYGPSTLHRLSFQGVDFFNRVPRWSATGSDLKRQLEETTDPQSRLALAPVIESLSDRLPPMEVAALRRLLTPSPTE